MALELVFNSMATETPESFRDKLKRGIFAETDTQSRIKKMMEEIKEFAGRGLIGTDMEDIIRIGMRRILMSWDYRLKKKSKFGNRLKEALGKKWAKNRGKLYVIKAFRFDKVDDVEEKANTCREIYLLPDAKVN